MDGGARERNWREERSGGASERTDGRTDERPLLRPADFPTTTIIAATCPSSSERLHEIDAGAIQSYFLPTLRSFILSYLLVLFNTMNGYCR